MLIEVWGSYVCIHRLYHICIYIYTLYMYGYCTYIYSYICTVSMHSCCVLCMLLQRENDILVSFLMMSQCVIQRSGCYDITAVLRWGFFGAGWCFLFVIKKLCWCHIWNQSQSAFAQWLKALDGECSHTPTCTQTHSQGRDTSILMTCSASLIINCSDSQPGLLVQLIKNVSTHL